MLQYGIGDGRSAIYGPLTSTCYAVSHASLSIKSEDKRKSSKANGTRPMSEAKAQSALARVISGIEMGFSTKDGPNINKYRTQMAQVVFAWMDTVFANRMPSEVKSVNRMLKETSPNAEEVYQKMCSVFECLKPSLSTGQQDDPPTYGKSLREFFKFFPDAMTPTDRLQLMRLKSEERSSAEGGDDVKPCIQPTATKKRSIDMFDDLNETPTKKSSPPSSTPATVLHKPPTYLAMGTGSRLLGPQIAASQHLQLPVRPQEAPTPVTNLPPPPPPLRPTFMVLPDPDQGSKMAVELECIREQFKDAVLVSVDKGEIVVSLDGPSLRFGAKGLITRKDAIRRALAEAASKPEEDEYEFVLADNPLSKLIAE